MSIWNKISNIFTRNKKGEQMVQAMFYPGRAFSDQTVIFDQRDAIILDSFVPASTTDKLYNSSGTLMFNGEAVTTVKSSGALVFTPSTIQNLVAGTGITAPMIANAILRVAGTAGPITVSATPSIAAGADGQLLIIQGTDDVNTVTLDDSTTTPGSTLELAGDTAAVLGKGDVLILMYNATDAKWYEISRSNN